MIHGPASYRLGTIGRWLQRGSRTRMHRLLGRCIASPVGWMIPDALVIGWNHREAFNRSVNWRHPRSLNEKTCWMMRYARDPILTQCADKVAVRDFVRERGAGEHLTTCYGVWDHVDDIPWERLPNAFVVKVAWGSRMTLFCRDRSTFDVAQARTQLAEWTRTNFYWVYREWAYRDVRPRIIVEELLLDERGQIPADFKIYCYDGIPRFLEVVRGRFTPQVNDVFYSPAWERLPIWLVMRPGEDLPRPAALDTLLRMVRRLSAGFPFVRVDCYVQGPRVVFGEMTWYTAAGMAPCRSDTDNLTLGSWFNLPPLRYTLAGRRTRWLQEKE